VDKTIKDMMIDVNHALTINLDSSPCSQPEAELALGWDGADEGIVHLHYESACNNLKKHIVIK